MILEVLQQAPIMFLLMHHVNECTIENSSEDDSDFSIGDGKDDTDDSDW